MTTLKQTKKSHIKLLYQMMYDIHQIFTKNDITYWTDGGTFLGSVRHKGIIPWDDDLDIAVLNNDFKKIKKIEKSLNKCGYKLIKHWLGYKISYKNRKNIKDFDYSFPFLDIISYKKYDKKIVPSLKDVRDIWPKAYFITEDLFPLKKYKFGDFYINGPKLYNEYFSRLYEKNWNKIAYRQYDHQNEEIIETIKVKLTKKMKEPAKPTKVKNRKCI